MAPRGMHPISYSAIRSLKIVSDELNGLMCDHKKCAERINAMIAKFLETEQLSDGSHRQVIGHLIVHNSKEVIAAAHLRSLEFSGQIYGDDRNPSVWGRIAAAAAKKNLTVIRLRQKLAAKQVIHTNLEVNLDEIDLDGIDLDEIDLDGIDLDGIDLDGIDLDDIDLLGYLGEHLRK